MTEEKKENLEKEELEEQEETKNDATSKSENSESREGFIPRDRFDEVNSKAKKLEAEIEKINAERKKAVEDRLEEQEEWRELAEKRGKELTETRAKAEQLEAYEETLKSVLNAQIENIPERYKGLVPDALSTQQKLDWLAKNIDLLTKTESIDVGAGKQGGDEPEDELELTAEEKQIAADYDMTVKEYVKYKDKEE